MGARAVAASGAGGESDEGIALFQPYGLPLVHRSLYCRALSLGLCLEELFLLGWAMGSCSRVAAGSDYQDFIRDGLWCFAAQSTYTYSAAAAGRKELFAGVPERMGAYLAREVKAMRALPYFSPMAHPSCIGLCTAVCSLLG
jgi:hypothetical protein